MHARATVYDRAGGGFNPHTHTARAQISGTESPERRLLRTASGTGRSGRAAGPPPCAPRSGFRRCAVEPRPVQVPSSLSESVRVPPSPSTAAKRGIHRRARSRTHARRARGLGAGGAGLDIVRVREDVTLGRKDGPQLRPRRQLLAAARCRLGAAEHAACALAAGGGVLLTLGTGASGWRCTSQEICTRRKQAISHPRMRLAPATVSAVCAKFGRKIRPSTVNIKDALLCIFAQIFSFETERRTGCAIADNVAECCVFQVTNFVLSDCR